MGFDPRRWRPSSGSRPLTTNVEALLAENEALRREVRSLRLQLEAFLQGEVGSSRSWESAGTAPEPEAAAAADRGGPWTSSARARASRPFGSQAEPPRSRVTVGSSHGISADLVERWGRSLARHPRWQELRLGPPGGLRGLEQELRRHWWNPSLSLEQELDRRSPGLGGELSEALRGPHSRSRWAVRAAFALYGPRAPEWLSEEPLRVVDDLLRRVQQLEKREGSGEQRRGTRTANSSGADAGRSASGWSASGAAASGHAASGRASAGRGASRAAGRDRQTEAGRQAGNRSGAAGSRRDASGQEQAAGQRHRRGSDRTSQEQAASGSRQANSRHTPPRDPRAQALAQLGLEPGASAAAIKRAYRRLAKTHHPDLGGDAEAFRRLDAAYRSLL